MAKKKTTDFQITSTGRSAVVLKTTLKIGAKKTKNKVLRKIKSEQAESTEQEEHAIAEILFKGLCQLRGTAIKIAQTLSSDTGLLRPEHLAVLQQTQYQVPPLNPVIIAKVFRNEFQKDPNDIFLEFDNRAWAAASLGQVHRAKLANGIDVAVKVQYPGIDQTISIDLGIAKKFISAIPRNGLILNSLSHIESRLHEEVDYQNELANAQAFERCFGNSDIVIPKVFPEITSKKIITYEYLSGQHLREWLATNPPANLRARLSQSLWNFFISSLETHQLLHCDPNWGNYLITDEQKLGVLDFGCVQKISPSTCSLFRELRKPITSTSKNKIIDIYIAMGAEPALLDNNSHEPFYEKMILPYQRWLTMITSGGEFDFGTNQKLSQQGQKILSKELFSPSMQNFSSEFTLVHRTFFGIIQMLEALGSTIRTDF